MSLRMMTASARLVRPSGPARRTADVRAEAGLYDQVAQDVSATVIRAYSSSFGLACRLLRQPVRDRVRSVYAMVRLADELVDGPLGVRSPDSAGRILDRLETETSDALVDGYSSNLVIHAFACTARECGIGMDLMTPFFASMRADLTMREHDDESLASYIYGSAEVVGLMCLRVFMSEGEGRAADDELVSGARRLGAAFQKVNFLRDLEEDYRLRGRRYFPELDPRGLDEAQKHVVLDDIDEDLAAAAAVIERLPDSSRSAVLVAHAIFAELAYRLRDTPAPRIRQHRCRVPGYRKAWITASVLAHERVA